MRINTVSLKNEIKNLREKADKEITNQDYKTGYFSALSIIEGVIAEIEEDEKQASIKDTMAKLKACPDIPNEIKYWGKTYQSQCPCGGIITAARNMLNGHMRAVCDKCHWNMIE